MSSESQPVFLISYFLSNKSYEATEKTGINIWNSLEIVQMYVSEKIPLSILKRQKQEGEP